MGENICACFAHIVRGIRSLLKRKRTKDTRYFVYGLFGFAQQGIKKAIVTVRFWK